MDVKENVFFKVKKTKKEHLLQQEKQPKIAKGINLESALPCGKVSLVKGGRPRKRRWFLKMEQICGWNCFFKVWKSPKISQKSCFEIKISAQNRFQIWFFLNFSRFFWNLSRFLLNFTHFFRFFLDFLKNSYFQALVNYCLRKSGKNLGFSGQKRLFWGDFQLFLCHFSAFFDLFSGEFQMIPMTALVQ